MENKKLGQTYPHNAGQALQSKRFHVLHLVDGERRVVHEPVTADDRQLRQDRGQVADLVGAEQQQVVRDLNKVGEREWGLVKGLSICLLLKFIF